MQNVDKLICPKCKGELKLNNKSLVCEKKHSYDIAKEGYCNLLLVDKKNSHDPGENKEQVRARREFFEKDYFKPLIEEIRLALKGKGGTLLDAGCGTGYYINNLKEKFNCIGIDISKEAVKIASKDTKCDCICSSIYDMPIGNKSIDVILSIFAPKPINEFKRVLKDDGVILEVIPGEFHMVELKERMYESIYLNNPSEKKLEGFTKKYEKGIKYQKMLEKSDVEHLIKMTPYAFSGEKNFASGMVTLDFIVKIWIK